mmetsp:Transcript_41194/g.104766  ORF Transcript_41194/g.104766 Transcript_41194/m.104766 type:complete len:633 (+) Transcript_41194:111-2009(+)
MHVEKSHLRELALQQVASPQAASTMVRTLPPISAESEVAAAAVQESWQQCEDVLKGLEEQRHAMQRSLEDWLCRLEGTKQQLLMRQNCLERVRPPVVTAPAPDITLPGKKQPIVPARLATTPPSESGRIETVLLVDGLGDDPAHAPPQEASICRPSSRGVGPAGRPHAKTVTSPSKQAWGHVAATQLPTDAEQPVHASRRGSQIERKKTQMTFAQKKSWRDRLTHSVNQFVANSGLEKAVKACSAEGGLENRLIWKLTHCIPFTAMASAMIVLNAVFVGAEAQHNFNVAFAGGQVSAFWGNLEVAFSVWFTFELILRVWAEKITFFVGPEWKMNALDCVLVLVSVIGAVVNPAGTASKATMARILRLFRFVRIFRIVRVMKAFHSLRLLAFSIMESMGALFWCAIIVFTAIYLFAVFFLDGATEFVRDHPLERTGHIAVQLEENFGSVMRAMICLFMTISGGIDWKDATTPLRSVHWSYEPIFVFYAFVMLFGVLNVVVATFVENTAQISRKDKEAMVFNEMRRVTEYAECIKAFFHDADTDKSGMLSWEEFERHLDDNRVKAYFQALELDVSEAHLLFELLDQDDSDAVEIDEFVGGCMRLKGTARSLDVNMIMRRIDRLSARLDKSSEGA